MNQWPLGYEPNELPDCSTPRWMLFGFNWRRRRDSNPRWPFGHSRFSRPTPSTRLGYVSMFLVVLVGLEPTTNRLWAGCSADWAKGPMVARERLELSTPWVWTMCSSQLSYLAKCFLANIWWSEPGSNRRPLVCKTSALPTELSPHGRKDRIWTCDPLVPNQVLCQAELLSGIWRAWQESNS